MPGNAMLAKRAMGNIRNRGQMNAQRSMNNTLPGRGLPRMDFLNQQQNLQERPFGRIFSPLMNRKRNNSMY